MSSNYPPGVTGGEPQIVGYGDEETYTMDVSAVRREVEQVRDNITDPVYAVDPSGAKWRIVEVTGTDGEVWLAIDGWDDKPFPRSDEER